MKHKYNYDDIVIVRNSIKNKTPVDNMQGVIVGMSQHEISGEWAYSVYINSRKEVFFIEEMDLTPIFAGRRVD